MLSWFEKLFGFKEEGSTKDVQEKFEMEPGSTMLKSKINGKEYDVGEFKTPSPGSLRITHEAVSDIFKLHSEPENSSAMFQAASQFNCLEFASPHVTPEDGVTGYESDNTQGPACSLAAAPATVYRNYFADTNGQVGQSGGNQLNNLGDLLDHVGPTAKDYLKVKNGYVASNNESLAEFNKLLEPKIASEEGREELLGKLRIGVHSGVEVPFTSRFKVAKISERTKVSQAFCSALSIAYTNGGHANWHMIAQCVLDATYEATLRAAAIEQAEGSGSGKVYLTFIGGGVFGNDQGWIQAAIARACRKLKNYPLQVVVCHYRAVDDRTQAAIDGLFQGDGGGSAKAAGGGI
eukprot:gene13073-33652_t